MQMKLALASLPKLALFLVFVVVDVAYAYCVYELACVSRRQFVKAHDQLIVMNWNEGGFCCLSSRPLVASWPLVGYLPRLLALQSGD